MPDVVPFIVAGIASGASYALLALSLVLIHNSSRLLSFMHGELGVFAAFIVASLTQTADVPWLIAIPTGVLSAVAISASARAVLLRGETHGKLPPLVGTIAVMLLLLLIEFRYFQTADGPVRGFDSPISGNGITVFDVLLSPTRLLVIGAAGLICVLLFLLVSRTNMGLAMRASADNPAAARIVGLRPTAVDTTTWVIAGLLAACGGILLGWESRHIEAGFLTLALPKAFTAAIVGGMTSLPGAIVGGVAVGLVESLSLFYAGNVPGIGNLIVFVLLFVVLLVRPQGIFGKREAGVPVDGGESALVQIYELVRVPSAPARALVARLRHAAPVAAPLIAAGFVAYLISSEGAFKLSLIPIYVILALSLNFLVTTTGQISLAHVGLLGISAFMTGVAASTWHWPALMAIAVGALTSALVSFLIGIAALRVTGLYLAVMTLSFAVTLESYVFPRPEFAKGGAGLGLTRPRFWIFNFESDTLFLFACVTVLALMWVLERKLMNSPFGRALVATRTNEVAAAARGTTPAPLKITAFVISGFWAGVAGALFAYRLGFLVASTFPLFLSFNFILYVVIGGIGSRLGVVVATVAFVGISTYDVLGNGNDWLLIGGALAVVLTIGAHPDGLAGQVRGLSRRRHSDPEPASAVQASGAA